MRFFRCIVLGTLGSILLSCIVLLNSDNTRILPKGDIKDQNFPNIYSSNEDVESLEGHDNTKSKQLKGNTISKSKPRQHIAFLKVHKAASTTAQNIFLRYGFQRNLSFVLPVPRKYHYPHIISLYTTVNDKNVLPPPKNKSFDILCSHVIYNRKAFQTIMPNDTVYIGIVRYPLEQFRSTLRYIHPSEVYDILDPNPISIFFSNPELYTRNRTYSFVNNRMAFEYNFPKSLFETKNSTDIENYLQKLASEFSLIIVVEYFEESVLLMRRMLHWDIKDILYVKKNESKRKDHPKLTLKDKQRHRQWAVLEYALYDFFFKRLWDQINGEGPDFFEELLFFKSLRREVTSFCLGRNGIKNYKMKKTKWNDEFSVSEYDCELMFKRETQFVQTIDKKQYGNINY